MFKIHFRNLGTGVVLQVLVKGEEQAEAVAESIREAWETLDLVAVYPVAGA
jgi:hypothetical protein